VIGYLISIIILLIALNIFVIYFFVRFIRKQRITEHEAFIQSINEYVNQVEENNDKLLENILEHFQEKEILLNDRIHLLEEKLEQKEKAILKTENVDMKIEEESSPNITNHEFSTQEEKYTHILTLFKQGFTPNQIAKVLHIQQGEVELVLNMNK